MVERCPFQSTLDLLGRKHNLSILWALSERRPRRFSELRDALAVNPATLTERLRDLEDAGVVTSTRYNEAPPRVDYDLSPGGAELLALVDHLRAWSADRAPVRRRVR
jgi:DNA-binding HxlR family transcriptional regulator